jgi:hypothetical protein
LGYILGDFSKISIRSPCARPFLSVCKRGCSFDGSEHAAIDHARSKSVGHSKTRVARWFVFKPKIPILGKFWRVLLWKILVYFVTIWSILMLLEIFYGHLVNFVVIWYIFPRFGILCQEKSGNLEQDQKTGRPDSPFGRLFTLDILCFEYYRGRRNFCSASFYGKSYALILTR